VLELEGDKWVVKHPVDPHLDASRGAAFAYDTKREHFIVTGGELSLDKMGELYRTDKGDTRQYETGMAMDTRRFDGDRWKIVIKDEDVRGEKAGKSRLAFYDPAQDRVVRVLSSGFYELAEKQWVKMKVRAEKAPTFGTVVTDVDTGRTLVCCSGTVYAFADHRCAPAARYTVGPGACHGAFDARRRILWMMNDSGAVQSVEMGPVLSAETER
jgi:hypothetical protein